MEIFIHCENEFKDRISTKDDSIPARFTDLEGATFYLWKSESFKDPICGHAVNAYYSKTWGQA